MITNEVARPTGLAGSDELWPDSTAHRWKMNNNNGGPDVVVGAATTDSFSNKSFGSASVLNFYKLATDTPGAITVNAGTCTDRTVTVTGLATTGIIAVGAAYALDANIIPVGGQAASGTAHYRLCNPTAGNITLNAAAAFNIETFQ